MIKYIVCGVEMELPNFTLAEARCHGLNPNGSVHDCGLIILEPDFLLCLGLVRRRYDRPIFMSSWTRCLIHNADVGGSVTDQHLLGRAADLLPVRGGDIGRLRRICDQVFPYTEHHNSFIHCDVRRVQ